MKYVRSFFQWVYLFLSWWILVIPYVIALLTPGGILHWLARFLEKKVWASSYVLFSRIHLTVKDLDEIDWSRPYVIMSNHNSFFDIVVHMAKLPVWNRWVAKKILFEVPVLGWSMYFRDDISIDRRNHEASVASFGKAAKSLRDGGRSIIIFPKGTRGGTEEIGPFKKGAFKIANVCRVPIKVVVIENTQRLYKPGRFLFRTGVPNTITVKLVGHLEPDQSEQPSKLIHQMHAAREMMVAATDTHSR